MFWEEGWAFRSAWKTASRTHSMTGSQQFTPLSFPHVGPEVQSWTYQQVKPAIFVHSQTAALRQNGVGKRSLPQHCASSVLSSHLCSPIPCKPTIVMPYHRTSVCTGVITKAVIFFKLRVCQLIQPEHCQPTASCCCCKHAQTTMVSLRRLIPGLDLLEIVFEVGFLLFALCFKGRKKANVLTAIKWMTFVWLCRCKGIYILFFFFAAIWFSIISLTHSLLDFIVYLSGIIQSLKLERRGNIFTGLRLGC